MPKTWRQVHMLPLTPDQSYTRGITKEKLSTRVGMQIALKNQTSETEAISLF